MYDCLSSPALTPSQANPTVAPVYFALYMWLVYLVCMNLAIAILTIALEEVTEKFKVRRRGRC
jgi:hypothetical protein